MLMQGAHTVYTSCGFQSNLQVQSSLAKAVTADRKVVTNSRTLHTLNDSCKLLKTVAIHNLNTKSEKVSLKNIPLKKIKI